jgi:transposase
MHLFYGSNRLRDDLLRFAVQCRLPEKEGGLNGPCIIIDSNNIVRTDRLTDIAFELAIEPKENLTVSSRGHWAYGQLIREYRSDPEEWKRSHSYGRRSLAETVFSVMKQRNGECLSSRGHKQRRRELLIRVVLHNIERLSFLECAGR